jgi:sugar diacid utilization regulator
MDCSPVFGLYNWGAGAAYAVVVIQTIDSGNHRLRCTYICDRLEEAFPGACAVFGDNHIACVVKSGGRDQDDLHAIKHELALCLRDLLCMAGISDLFYDPANIWDHYIQASEAVRLGQKRDPHSWFFLYDDYILDYILENAAGKLKLQHVLHKGLSKLFKYDSENCSSYAESLYYYIDYSFNASAAAQKAYVHRSTFIRRLERISEISGIDLYDSDEVLHVFISFKLLDIDGSLPFSPRSKELPKSMKHE